MHTGEPRGIEQLCICNSICVSTSVSLSLLVPPGITLCSIVSLHSSINHDTSAAIMSEAATMRGWPMLAQLRLCLYYWHQSASRRCLQESSSAWGCHCTRTLVNLPLLGLSDSIFTYWSHTCTAVVAFLSVRQTKLRFDPTLPFLSLHESAVM